MSVVDWDWATQTGNQEPQPVIPPQPLTSYSWFTGNHDRFKVLQIQQSLNDIGYYTCAEGDGLEAPTLNSYPLTSDGKLRLTDIHGGFGDWTTIHLADCRTTPEDQVCPEMYNILLSWDRPGTWGDCTWPETGFTADYAPGSERCTLYGIYHGGFPFGGISSSRIVAWVSGDIGVQGQAGPSPHYVDAADQAYFMTKYGRPVRWGFDSESPPNDPTWQADVNPFNGPLINGHDLSLLASYMGDSCQLSKPGSANELAAMLDWFGIAATGMMVEVGPPGETMTTPEYEIVDWEKNRRAIADPYGYRTNLNSAPAKEAPWGLVKQLYR